ncbi:NAD(P)H-binding protein [Allorhodopirellula heiligendammensis]|nr:NAD(P)H-binding protein [Allorhodopirellula heiligendammensis]
MAAEMPNYTQTVRRPRVAIAGATGQVGAALVQTLSGDRIDVVALTRDPGNGRIPTSVDVAKIDFEVPRTLMDALQGTDRLFLAHGTSDRQVANEIAIIDAVVAAGISHIVKLSAMGPPTRLHPFNWHIEIEAHLAKQDIGYAVLRSGPFVNGLARAGATVIDGTWGGAAGEGRVNLVDTRDVADVARIALLDDNSTGSQRAYHLTGPNAVSMPEVALELSRLLGQMVEYRHRDRAEHRKLLIESGASDMAADLRLGLDRLFKDSVLAETTNTILDVTGKKARSVSGWLSDNLSLFQRT